AEEEDAPVPIPRRVRGGPAAGYSPTLFLYEHTPGGIGLAERIFVQRDLLLARALRLVNGCPCVSGCPACVGPAIEGAALPGAVPPVPPQRAKPKQAIERTGDQDDELDGEKPVRANVTGRKAIAIELMRRALGSVRALTAG
ncbi:MAG: ATP-dependent helicase, partial [Labilithrix sp.]|nr:ATP-dependent helicase [Labilithrix sp.]